MGVRKRFHWFAYGGYYWFHVRLDTFHLSFMLVVCVGFYISGQKEQRQISKTKKRANPD